MKGQTKGERPRKLEVEKKYVKVKNKTKNNVKHKYNCDMREFTKTEESLKKKNQKLSQHKDIFKNS